MMRTEKKNPASPARARGADEHRKINSREPIPIYSDAQRRAAARLAPQIGLSVSVALVVVTLAGLGGRPA